MCQRSLILAAALLSLAGCARHETRWEPQVSPSSVRASRRAYDGAPPVIPHAPLGGSCTSCHTSEARPVPGVGVAPANPHLKTPGMSDASRCVQCHVFQTTKTEFISNRFVGLPQDLRRGGRLYPGAPPTIPHAVFLHEDCRPCHTGEAARPEVRCSHPERTNCVQCHAPERR